MGGVPAGVVVVGVAGPEPAAGPRADQRRFFPGTGAGAVGVDAEVGLDYFTV